MSKLETWKYNKIQLFSYEITDTKHVYSRILSEVNGMYQIRMKHLYFYFGFNLFCI